MSAAQLSHQFIERSSGRVQEEILLRDRQVRWLYNELRESAPRVFRWLTHSPSVNDFLAKINFDRPFKINASQLAAVVRNAGIDLSELVEPLPGHPTWRQVFGRQIRFWETRQLPMEVSAILAPCDAKLLVGSLAPQTRLSIKGKFFELTELLGGGKQWSWYFENGSWALFRLTPDLYHYNHCPVSGVVEDVFEEGGAYHSCNPTAIIQEVTPMSKNRRVVTIINTDCLGGSKVGRVAMIEVVALLIGRVRQAYSEYRYVNPSPVSMGMFLTRGAVKSEFMPGSSTTIVLFEPGRVQFDTDLLANQFRRDVRSRFSDAHLEPLVETLVRVRTQIGMPCRERASTVKLAGQAHASVFQVALPASRMRAKPNAESIKQPLHGEL